MLGVYVMGKAATLDGQVGDVMIPSVVYDEHSGNTFLFKNASFPARRPYLRHGTVFDNQKAVTVRGTFLQNREFMGVFYREGYTDLEMEAGPYLTRSTRTSTRSASRSTRSSTSSSTRRMTSAYCTTRRTRRTAAGRAC